MRDFASAPNADTTANRVAPAALAARAVFTTKSKSTCRKAACDPATSIVVPSAMNTSFTRRERCGQPCQVDLVNLQLCTGFDVRRRAALQNMHAAANACWQAAWTRARDRRGRSLLTACQGPRRRSPLALFALRLDDPASSAAYRQGSGRLFDRPSAPPAMSVESRLEQILRKGAR